LIGFHDCYRRFVSGYDGVHPDAWGEFLSANAFSQILVNGFGMGSSPLAVPAQTDPRLPRDLPVPSNFRLVSSPQGVTATWDAGKPFYVRCVIIELILFSSWRIQL